jgi:hypothetical protein
MTKDLALLWDGDADSVTSEEFLDAIAGRMEEMLSDGVDVEAEEFETEFETVTLVDDEGGEVTCEIVYRAIRGEEEYAVLMDEEGGALVLHCVYDGEDENSYHFEEPDEVTAESVFAEFEEEMGEPLEDGDE